MRQPYPARKTTKSGGRARCGLHQCTEEHDTLCFVRREGGWPGATLRFGVSCIRKKGPTVLFRCSPREGEGAATSGVKLTTHMVPLLTTRVRMGMYFRCPKHPDHCRVHCAPQFYTQNPPDRSRPDHAEPSTPSRSWALTK